jgi:hypothetical protein
MFLIIVVALVIAAMSRLSSAQHGTNSLAIQQARAYQAARSGLDWGITQAINAGNCAAGSPSLAGGNLSDFAVVVVPYPTDGRKASRAAWQLPSAVPARPGARLEPGHLYVVPPGDNVVVEQGRFLPADGLASKGAVWALFGPELDRLRAAGQEPDAELKTRIDAVRAEYEEQLDALHAGARGHVDAVLEPERLRDRLGFALWTALHNPGPHLGPFSLPREVFCQGS